MPALFDNGRSFADLVERAPPGSVIPYHVGFLVIDAEKDPRVKDIARMARSLSNGSMPTQEKAKVGLQYGMGIGTLTQRKIGEDMYEYCFTKTAL